MAAVNHAAEVAGEGETASGETKSAAFRGLRCAPTVRRPSEDHVTPKEVPGAAGAYLLPV